MTSIKVNGISLQYEIGNCIELMRAIPDNSIDLILTDPPYNKNKDYCGVPDNKPQIEFDSFNRMWLGECFRILKVGHHLYFSCASDQPFYFMKMGENIGYKYRHLLIWATNECRGHMNARTWLRSYEPILWFQKPGDSYGLFNNYPFPALDVLLYRSPHTNTKGMNKKSHICQKPVELFQNIIMKASKKGDTVLDPFIGSGTTLLACKLTKRNGLGFELNPAYEKMIRNRIEVETTIEDYFDNPAIQEKV